MPGLGALAENGIDQKARDHNQNSQKRLQRPVNQKIVHHEGGHEQENHRSDRVSPGTIGPRQVGPGDAQLDDAQHGEERAEQQPELDEIEHGLETAGEQHQAGDRELEKDGIGRRAMGRFAGEYPQRRDVFPHRHHDARADPHHRADGRYKANADHRADDAAADFAEDVAARDAGDIELPGQLVDRRGVEKHGVQGDIQHENDQRPRQQRARQVLLRGMHLADDVGRSIPPGERIHHEYQPDRERRAGDMAEVGCRRRERDRLRRADDKSRDQEGDDQHDLQDGRDQLKSA